MTQPHRTEEPQPTIFRKALAIGAVVAFLLLTWYAGRWGLSSLLAVYAAKTGNIVAANAAVRFDQGNADAHYVRGAILEAGSDLAAAVDDYEKAAIARPDDYVLWLSLARARELNGETEGAIEAARRAVPLAPEYVQPHYQLGNILLRAGNQDEAFRELRLAGLSNPELMPGVIDLAWRSSGGNVQYVEQAMAPATEPEYWALARYFRQKQEVSAAIAMFMKAGTLAQDDRRSYVAELISAKQFREANMLWAFGRQTGAAPGLINDPGFEQESDLKDPGFGWRVSEGSHEFNLSLDTLNPREGRSSLKVEFAGVSDASVPVISELVLAEPSSHYELSLAMRSENLVSGGWPQVVVIDAESSKPLAQTDPFPRATEGWRDYVLKFDSGPSTTAVTIALQRQPCAAPCPIFGRLWLDNFALRKL